MENLSLLLERGRSRILKINDIKYLESLLKKKADWYLWELQSEMELWMNSFILYFVHVQFARVYIQHKVSRAF